MSMCQKCSKICGGLFLLAFLAFLLVDIGTWDFWGIQWYTVLFLLLGLGIFGKGACAECKK